MPKNALFLLKKIVKIAKRPPDHQPPATRGFALRPPQQLPRDKFLPTRLAKSTVQYGCCSVYSMYFVTRAT